MYVHVQKEPGRVRLWVFANDAPWRITGRGTRFLQEQRGWHAWDQPYVSERTWEVLLEHGWAIKTAGAEEMEAAYAPAGSSGSHDGRSV